MRFHAQDMVCGKADLPQMLFHRADPAHSSARAEKAAENFENFCMEAEKSEKNKENGGEKPFCCAGMLIYYIRSFRGKETE